MENTLGERLKQLVKETRLDQQDVAALLGLKTPTFNGYIKKHREPTFEVLKQIADYFKVSIDYLLGYSDIRDPYLRHLSVELNNFVQEHENATYIELAMDIKARTLKTGNHKQSNII
jgi:transcriptional regulator with XRE-family HTH domain